MLWSRTETKNDECELSVLAEKQTALPGLAGLLCIKGIILMKWKGVTLCFVYTVNSDNICGLLRRIETVQTQLTAHRLLLLLFFFEISSGTSLLHRCEKSNNVAAQKWNLAFIFSYHHKVMIVHLQQEKRWKKSFVFFFFYFQTSFLWLKILLDSFTLTACSFLSNSLSPSSVIDLHFCRKDFQWCSN